MRKHFVWGVVLGFIGLASGCQQNADMVNELQCGDLGHARNDLLVSQVTDKSSRSYIIYKERLAIVTLADGYAYSGDSSMEDLFDILQKQGINQGKGVTDTILWQGATITWKGEPFEQALGFHYIATHYASLGDWGNARAAAIGSLFKLKNFSTDGKDVTTEELIKRDTQKKDYLENGYVAADTNFTLGYLMGAIANQQLWLERGDQGRNDEANDYYNRVESLNPALSTELSALRSDTYNTILIVDYGKGPEKYGRGPDGAIADFRAITPSGNQQLMFSSSDSGAGACPQVCDVNQMAQDHKWKNLEDVRIAKSYLGDALLTGATGAVTYGALADNATADYVGLGMAVAGLAVKAMSHCDTTYCEVMPQRIYVVPLMIRSPNTSVSLEVEGIPESRLVVCDLAPPVGKTAAVRNVRLPNPPPGVRASVWFTSARATYGNDYDPGASRAKYPYILGGDDVSTPTADALRCYQSAGYLTDLSLSDLQQLYKLEGISTSLQADGGVPRLHVLEGGKSLVPPEPGTIGYTRLFCQAHAPYKPTSDRVRQLAAVCAQQAKNHAGGSPVTADVATGVKNP
jgi:hypothetical protein